MRPNAKKGSKKKAGAEDSTPRPAPKPTLATSAQLSAPVAPSVSEASMLNPICTKDKPESCPQEKSAPLGAQPVAPSGNGTGAIPKLLSKRQKKIADRELKNLEGQLKQSLISCNDPNESFVLVGTQYSPAEPKKSRGAAIVSASVVKVSDMQELRVPPQTSYYWDQVESRVREVTVPDHSQPTNNQQLNPETKNFNALEKRRSRRFVERSEKKLKCTKSTQTTFETMDKGIQVNEAANQEQKQQNCNNTSGRSFVVSTSREIKNAGRSISRESFVLMLKDFNKIFNVSHAECKDEQIFDFSNIGAIRTYINVPVESITEIDLDSVTDNNQIMRCLAAKYLPEWKQKLIFGEDSSANKVRLRDVVVNKMSILSEVAHIFYQLEKLSDTNDSGITGNAVESNINGLNDKQAGQMTIGTDAHQRSGSAAARQEDYMVKVGKNQTIREQISNQEMPKQNARGADPQCNVDPIPSLAPVQFDQDDGGQINIQEILHNLSERPQFIFSDTTIQLLSIPDKKCKKTEASAAIISAPAGFTAEKISKGTSHRAILHDGEENRGSKDEPVQPKGSILVGEQSECSVPVLDEEIAADKVHLAVPRTPEENKIIVQQFLNRMNLESVQDLPIALCKEEMEILQAFRKNHIVLILSPKDPTSTDKQGNDF